MNKVFATGAIKSDRDNRDYLYDLVASNLPTNEDCYEIPQSSLFPIRNQGQEGSCVAFATAHIKEVQENIDTGLNEYISPRFIYNQRNNSVEGMRIRNALQILYRRGSLKEVDAPIENKEYEPSIEDFSKAFPKRIKGYARVKTIKAFKKALKDNHPILVVLAVKSYNHDFWNGNKRYGLHAVVATGWNKKGFILRNSWDIWWGFDGYTTLPYSDFNKIVESWTLLDDETEKWKANKDKLWFKIKKWFILYKTYFRFIIPILAFVLGNIIVFIGNS